MNINWLKASAVLAVLVAGSGAAHAAVIHNDGFTDGTNTTDYRGVGSFSVDLIDSSAHQAVISFDIFGARSVDGDNDWRDVFSLSLNDTTVFEGSFNLGGGGNNVVTSNPNGFGFTPISFGFFEGGKVSVSGLVDLIAGLNRFTFSFTSPGQNNGGDQGLGDESWGINNLDVAPVPLPAALPLLALAVAGLGFAGRRRRVPHV